MSIPLPGEVGALLTASEVPFRPFIGLCAFAGLRLGEAAAIQVQHVDVLRRTLTVARQVQRANKGRVEIRPPKYGSERKAFIPEGLVAMLAAHIETVGVRAEGWLFVGAGDAPPHQNAIGFRWRKTLEDAGLAGIKLHDLRHFYASGLIAQGCDVVTVQRALGHSTPTTTLNTRAPVAHGGGSDEEGSRRDNERNRRQLRGLPAESEQLDPL